MHQTALHTYQLPRGRAMHEATLHDLEDTSILRHRNPEVMGVT